MSLVTIYNNRPTVLHSPAVGRTPLSDEQLASMPEFARYRAQMRPTYKYPSMRLMPGANQLDHEHLEALEGHKRWVMWIKREWVSRDPQPFVRPAPRVRSYRKGSDEVPGTPLPNVGRPNSWPTRGPGTLLPKAKAKAESKAETKTTPKSRAKSSPDRIS